jgi:hypothetical protein
MNLLGFGKLFEKLNSSEHGDNKSFRTTRNACDWLANKAALLATALGGGVMVVLAGLGFVSPKENNNSKGQGNNNNNQRPHYRDRR